MRDAYVKMLNPQKIGLHLWVVWGRSSSFIAGSPVHVRCPVDQLVDGDGGGEFAVGGGGQAGEIVEELAEVIGVVEATCLGDLADGVGTRAEKFGRMAEA